MLICGNIAIQNDSLDLQYKQRLAFQIVSSYIFWKFPDIFENYIKSLNLIILLDQWATILPEKSYLIKLTNACISQTQLI